MTKQVIRTERMIVRNKDDIAYLRSLMLDATAIYNASLYFLRQQVIGQLKDQVSPFKIKLMSKFDLDKLTKERDVFKNSNLDYVVRQACTHQAHEAMKGFIEANKAFLKNPSKYTGKPKMPYYKPKDVPTALRIDSSRLRLTGCKPNELRIPKSDYKFKSRYKKSEIQCVRVCPCGKKVKIEIIYKKETTQANLDYNRYAGCDIGLSNLVALVVNDLPKSLLISGGSLKAVNQYFNKQKAKIQSELALTTDQKWSNKLDRLQIKRNNKIDNLLHNASRHVVNYLLENQIGNIVIGKNDGWKQNINIGKTNNQNFVSVPFARLIDMITYKCEDVGITVILTEESYTSKVDHLANEPLYKQNSYLGSRIKRGLFKSSTGREINADINGAIGILRKAKALSDIQLLNLGYRGDVVSPIKLHICCTCNS